MLRVARRTRPVQRMWALQLKVGSDWIPENHAIHSFLPVGFPTHLSYLFAAIQDMKLCEQQCGICWLNHVNNVESCWNPVRIP